MPRGGGGGMRGGGGARGGGFRGGGGGGFRHGGHFPRRFGGRSFFGAPGGWWGGGGYPYWYDEYPLLVVEDEEDEEERKRREELALLMAQQAAMQAAQLAAQQTAAAIKGKRSTKGLGIFAPKDKSARPLSESGLALGAATGPVPSACWSVQAFKDCQARVFARAQTDCPKQGYPNAAYNSYDDCVKDLADTYVGPSAESITCVSQYCPGAVPTAAGAGTYPWGTYSAATKTLQISTNEALKAAGYCPVTVDGKLGPATCGARKTLKDTGAVPGMTWPNTCQKFGTPSQPPCPGGAGISTAAIALPTGPAPITTAAMYPTPGAFNWKTAALIGAGALAVGGLVYFMKRREAR
jgi:hypothetical protein